MERDLFLAILAMDSYNRGYGQSVRLNPNDSEESQSEKDRTIGSAKVLFDANDPDGMARAAGSYAIGYEWNAASTTHIEGKMALGGIW